MSGEEETERATWGAFRKLAKRVKPGEAQDRCFNLEGGRDDDDAINMIVLKSDPTSSGNPAHVYRRVFFELAGLGLIVPTRPDQALNWNPGVFTFSERGLRYFRGEVALDVDPSPLRAKLLELQTKHPKVVGAAQLTLLSEAQHCWRERCYRAAMILTGLAAEDASLELVDALAAYPAKAAGGATAADWTTVATTSGMFSVRWGAAVRVLRKLRDALRGPGKGAAWWKILDPAPEWLLPLGEAVRLARNEAAHNPDREYGANDVTLLLAALPTQLEAIAELHAFLSSPPAGVSWPTV